MESFCDVRFMEYLLKKHLCNMKVLFLFLIITFSISALAQQGKDEILLRGQIYSTSTSSPVENAHIQVSDFDNVHAISAGDGSFQLTLPRKDTYLIRVSHISFKDSIYEIGTSPNVTQISVRLELRPVQFNIPEAIITGKPNEVYGSKVHHVADFVFRDNGMLLLTYEKEERWKRPSQIDKSIFQSCKLIWIDSLNQEKAVQSVHFKCHQFYSDFLKECFLETEEGVFNVKLKNDIIVLLPVSLEDFEELIVPIVDTINQHTLASSYHQEYPAFEYYGLNKKDSSLLHFCQIIDEPLMEQYRSEFKWLSPREKLEAYRLSLKHDIDKEVVGAMFTGFSQSIYYDELYAPLFVAEDTIEVFDHYKHLLYKFNEDLECVDSIPIQYHIRKHWSKMLIKDEGNHAVYALFERNGIHELRCVNKETGHITGTFQLYHKYPESIKIKNNQVYYTYRPFESSQKKFLYKETLHLSDAE
jgi:hypothetical protein